MCTANGAPKQQLAFLVTTNLIALLVTRGPDLIWEDGMEINSMTKIRVETRLSIILHQIMEENT